MTAAGSVLIVKFGAIGDVLDVVPTSRLLHEAGYRVDWLCGQGVRPVVDRYPWIHPIVVDDRALTTGSMVGKLRALFGVWKQLFGRRYSLCATLYYDSRYRAVLMPARSRCKIFLSGTDRRYMLVPGRSRADEYARIIMSELSVPGDEGGTRSVAPIQPSGQTPGSGLAPQVGPRVLLCPGGARNMLRDDPLRRWPLQSYVGLAKRLQDAGVEVILIGGPDDRWASPAFGEVLVLDTIGTLSLTQTWALMNEADVLVTHDTGPLHLAGASKIAVVALFGPTNPRTVAPRRGGVVSIWGGRDLACRPCYDGRNYANCSSNTCLQQVSIDTVDAQVHRALDRSDRGAQTIKGVALVVETGETVVTDEADVSLVKARLRSMRVSS